MLYKSSNPDMDKFMKYPKFLLSTMGCWPAVKSPFSWIYKVQRFIFAHFISSFFTASLILNLFFSLNDLATVADSVYFLSTNFTFLIKLMVFSKKNHRFEILLRDLENPLFLPTVEHHRKSMKKWIEKAYFYCALFAYSVVLCVSLFALFPVFDENIILPLLSWFPYDPLYSSLVYTMTYMFQVVGISICAIINVSLDLLPPVFMNIGCAQVEILKYNLEHAIEDSSRAAGKNDEIEIVDCDEENAVDDNYFEPLTKEEEEVLLPILVTCVKHHEAIIRLFYEIQYVFNPGMLVQFLSCAVTLCMTGFQLIVVPIMSVKFLSIAVYFFVMVVEVALYTINGHHVIVETATISDSCYDMEWYRCSLKVKKILIIIMERCKRPNLISAGGIFDLSITTLTFLLRTSYSYFTVLNRMYGE